jgi:hypothetical protein
MLFLKDAVQLTIEKVVQTVINIFLYRYTSRLLKNTISLNVVLGFFVTIFITQKLKGLIKYLSMQIKYCLKPDLRQQDQQNRFDKKKIKLMRLNELGKDDVLVRTLLDQANTHLFSYIFQSATNSALLNLFTIISIDYLTEKCGLKIYYSLFLCVFVTFLICFVSCLRYTNLIIKEWLQVFDQAHGYLMVNNKNDECTEPVCVWSGAIDENTTTHDVQIKYLNINYSQNLNEMIEIYLSNVSNSSDFNSFKIRVADYYDHYHRFTKYLRFKKFESTDEWTEYFLFLFVKYKIKVFEITSNELKNQFKLD